MKAPMPFSLYWLLWFVLLPFVVGVLLFATVGVAQTTPVQIDAGEPKTMYDGSPVRPNWFVFYNLYQGLTSTTLGELPVAGMLLPGATFVTPVKRGPCFSISAVAYYALDTPIYWFPLESPIAPAVSAAIATPGGCKAFLAGSTTYTVTLNVLPW